MISNLTTIRVSHPAEITFIDGSTVSGHVFVEEGSRTQDLFNDERPFVPFVTPDDHVLLLNKRNIRTVQVHD
ncbi:MAG: hypothetical protein ACE5H8_09545 [Alphaproteobacteria bacterium]